MSGINGNRIQRCLFQETDLTYKKALEIAQAMEVAAHDINDLQKELPHTATVQRLQIQKSKVSICYHCGNNHFASMCRFQQAKCRNCGKVGHIARFVAVKHKRCRRRPQKLKPHIICHKTHPLQTTPHHH